MLRLNDVSMFHGGRSVLRALDLTIERGEIVVVAGESGAGKTSLLRLIAGLDRPHNGQISWCDRSLAATDAWMPPWERPFAMVFQDLGLWPHLTVLEHLVLVLQSRPYVGRAGRKRLAQSCLARLRIPDLSHRYPAELSGGQQQRVAIARSLVRAPELLLLDEPFAHLDPMTAEVVWSSISDWRDATRGTILAVTHEPAWAAIHATQLWSLQQGRLQRQPQQSELRTCCAVE
jgi:iron(III) transport system ATP-binding protein